MSYQGWKNYPTRAVKLWIDNEQPSYEYWRERTQELVDDAGSKEETIRSDLAEALKSEFEEGAPELSGMWSDLMQHALDEVDWFEIAEAMIDDADEPEKEEEESPE